jgi:hypothetical protein
VASKPSTENVENETITADGSIPHQSTHHAAEKNEAVKFLVVDGEKVSLKERLKSMVNNKTVIAAVSTVAVLAAGVFIVNKRNDVASESEDENLSS